MTAFADYIVPVASAAPRNHELFAGTGARHQHLPDDPARQPPGGRDSGTLHLRHRVALRRDQQHSAQRPADHHSANRRPSVDALSHHVVAASSDQDDHVLIRYVIDATRGGSQTAPHRPGNSNRAKSKIKSRKRCGSTVRCCIASGCARTARHIAIFSEAEGAVDNAL